MFWDVPEIGFANRLEKSMLIGGTHRGDDFSVCHFRMYDRGGLYTINIFSYSALIKNLQLKGN